MNDQDFDNIDLIDFQDMSVIYRKQTTDFNCLREVLKQKCYQSKKHDFYIKKDEHWLDLGGNIGAFGLFAMSCGAKVVSYEPDGDCCEIMEINYSNNFTKDKFEIHNIAVTHQASPELDFWRGGSKEDRYRTSIFPNKKFPIKLKNIHASHVFKDQYDGVKMDIEGAELLLIDNNLIPDCNKLVMEYHITKDKSMFNFHQRMDILRKHFSQVLYMPSLDKFNINSDYPGFFDRIIICKK